MLDLKGELIGVERGADAAVRRGLPHGGVRDQPVQVVAFGQGDLGVVEVRIDDDEGVTVAPLHARA